MKIQPIGDRILVKRVESIAKKGGIIIPDTAKEKPMEAEVVEIGTGKIMKDGKRQPFEVKKGDKVIIEKYSGSEITIDDVEYLLIHEDNILGVVK